MLERIHRLEARDAGATHSPVPSTESPDLANDVRQLETKLNAWREQSVLKQGAEEDLLRLRLDSLENDVRACLQPKDLDAERQALQELRKQCESAVSDEGRVQYAALHSKLAEAADQLRGLLQAHSSAFEERLRICESRLTAGAMTPPQAASEASEPREESRRPGSTGSGAGAAGGASLESRVARLERNMKAAALGPPASDGRRLEEVATHALQAQQEVQRLVQRSQAIESRLSALDGLAASVAAGGDGASAAAVEALERRLEQHMEEKLVPLREQLSDLEAPTKITSEEKMDRGLLEEVHHDLLFGSPASPSAATAEVPALNAAREAVASASAPLTRDRTSSEVSSLHTKLRALAAQQDDRALRLEQEMKLLQQKLLESAAAQATAASGGSGAEASALGATLSSHDEELKKLAASIQGLQAAADSARHTAPTAHSNLQAPAELPSSALPSAASAPAVAAAAASDAKVEARLDALQRQLEAQAAKVASFAAGTTSGTTSAGTAGEGSLPSAEEVAGDSSLQASTAAIEARAGEALQRVAEAERRIFKLAEEVATLAEAHSAQAPLGAEDALVAKDLLEALAPADGADSADSAGAADAGELPQASDPESGAREARESALRGLDALLERLGGLEAKVSSHAESMQRLRQRMESSESKASSQATALAELSAVLARQAASPLDGPLASGEDLQVSQAEAEANVQQDLDPHETSRELQQAPGAAAEAPLAASHEGFARLLALEDKVAALSNSHQEVQQVVQSVSALQAQAVDRPPVEDVQVDGTGEGKENSGVMQALRDEVRDLATALASQRQRLDAALGSEESPGEGALHKEVRQLSESLAALRDLQPGYPEMEAEVQRLAAVMEELQRQVDTGLQLQQEVERVSASLSELRAKVEDRSVPEEVRRLGEAVASLERSKSGGLHQQVSKFAESLENLRFRQDDFLVQLKAAKAALQELPALKEELRAGREATDNLAQSHAKTKEATSTELHQLTQRLGLLEEKRLKQLGMDVQALQGALVHIQTELQKEVVIPDHILRDIDAKSEARQEAMWAELHKHAETAAHRADQLERSLSSRLVSLEHSTNALLQNEAHSREMEREMAKQSEWFAWRIAWLEWTATGEKRSFARPLLPPPATPAATCFKQPMTEDSELWAQEKTGQQRLRRAPLLRLPSAGPANAQRLAQTDASVRTLATSSSAPDLVVGPGTGGEKSVRLPQMS
ncbi:unnamed protein product [Symbiodinium natans]|uniref:Uncharacterized protein n=1 Tax=Symbiodinium natans TaxID=878477 RepID=A0A812LT61_9DINO|nr:unnamed protein product [Symbiodinium natans]